MVKWRSKHFTTVELEKPLYESIAKRADAQRHKVKAFVNIIIEDYLKQHNGRARRK